MKLYIYSRFLYPNFQEDSAPDSFYSVFIENLY